MFSFCLTWTFAASFPDQAAPIYTMIMTTLFSRSAHWQRFLMLDKPCCVRVFDDLAFFKRGTTFIPILRGKIILLALHTQWVIPCTILWLVSIRQLLHIFRDLSCHTSDSIKTFQGMYSPAVRDVYAFVCGIRCQISSGQICVPDDGNSLQLCIDILNHIDLVIHPEVAATDDSIAKQFMWNTIPTKSGHFVKSCAYCLLTTMRRATHCQGGLTLCSITTYELVQFHFTEMHVFKTGKVMSKFYGMLTALIAGFTWLL